jgi:hypothetical protein
VAAGQSQRFYSGVGIFNWYYLSSPPQILRFPEVDLESGWLISDIRAHNIYIQVGTRYNTYTVRVPYYALYWSNANINIFEIDIDIGTVLYWRYCTCSAYQII